MASHKNPAFDLINLADIPDRVKRELSVDNEHLLMSLFSIKATLNKNEMIVGLYRICKREITRSALNSILLKLLNGGYFERVERGRYKKIKDLEI